jgi:hypothetical protein
MKRPQFQLNNSQKIIHEVSFGTRDGVSRNELVDKCRDVDGPGETTIDHELPKMVGLDVMRIVSPKGAKPFLYKPWEECEQEEDWDDVNTLVDEVDSSDDDLSLMLKLASHRARDIINHISENDSWRKPRKIKSICRNEISPFVGTILSLQGMGCQVPAPWDYAPFWSSRPRAFWEGLTGPKDLSGPIRLCRDAESRWDHGKRGPRLTIDSTGKQVVHPNLLEWRAYLSKVATILDSEPPPQRKKSK